jgi:hypothetical protein
VKKTRNIILTMAVFCYALCGYYSERYPLKTSWACAHLSGRSHTAYHFKEICCRENKKYNPKIEAAIFLKF